MFSRIFLVSGNIGVTLCLESVLNIHTVHLYLVQLHTWVLLLWLLLLLMLHVMQSSSYKCNNLFCKRKTKDQFDQHVGCADHRCFLCTTCSVWCLCRFLPHKKQGSLMRCIFYMGIHVWLGPGRIRLVKRVMAHAGQQRES